MHLLLKTLGRLIGTAIVLGALAASVYVTRLTYPQPFEVELERAKAALLLTQSEVRALSNAVAAATAEVKRLKDESTYAGDHAKRIEQLVNHKFVTQDRFEEARVKQRSAVAALERAQQELERQKHSLAQFGDVNARLKAAEAAVHGVE